MRKFSILFNGLMVLALLVAFGPVMSVSAAGHWHGPDQKWQVPGDFATIQEAIDSADVAEGDTIFVGNGSHAGAMVNKTVKIVGKGRVEIDSGPAHSSGLVQGFRLIAGSDGSSFSNLTFKVDLAIMNGEAVNNVTVDHCTFINTIQGVSNWRGSGWNIHHNNIIDLRTRNGGGIGILIGDYNGTAEGVKNNIVTQNKIRGTLHVYSADGGGYNGTGIVLYADFRWGRAGAVAISNNNVSNNKIALKSDNAEVVDVVGIELTDSRDDDTLPCVIFDNSIGFNDLRGTELEIVLTPESLADCNNISKNHGDNRGHGLHPLKLRPSQQFPKGHKP